MDEYEDEDEDELEANFNDRVEDCDEQDELRATSTKDQLNTSARRRRQ